MMRGLAADVICPKLDDDRVVPEGLFKLTKLNAFVASPRICKVSPSRMLTSRRIARSKPRKPGPRRKSRGVLPSAPPGPMPPATPGPLGMNDLAAPLRPVLNHSAATAA